MAAFKSIRINSPSVKRERVALHAKCLSRSLFGKEMGLR